MPNASVSVPSLPYTDLSLIEKRIKEGDYYRNREMLQADLLRMCRNCKTYNQPATEYYT